MRGKGPMPRFMEIHIWKALELIGKHNRVGRKRLVEKLGVGEGSTRTILNKLKAKRLVTSSKGGHSITEKGRKLLKTAPHFLRVDAGDLTVGKFDVATTIKGAAKRVKLGLEQRDEAIKAGADGATVLVFSGGKLRFPDSSTEVKGQVAAGLVNTLRPKDGDAVVIGSGGTAGLAEDGARAAAASLTRKP
ncbi:MAG: DUF4443 domain-containing protein [Candidatus Hadarchaeota archaeon]